MTFQVRSQENIQAYPEKYQKKYGFLKPVVEDVVTLLKILMITRSLSMSILTPLWLSSSSQYKDAVAWAHQ